ncbi:MAG: APC family permease [Pirellulales bacterium]|nr:APC family permease [Pirellulales bacterium]
MPKSFGFWTLSFLVVANMIGAGVFTTSGFSLRDLGTPQAVVWAWAIGGSVALAGATSYGLLVRAMPESGGEYLFLSRAAHPVFGFIAGWVSLIAGFSGAIAFAATAFEGYALPKEFRPAWLPERSVAVAIIVLAGLFHGVQVRVGALVQNVLVALKLVLLAAILTFAASHLPGGEPARGKPVDSGLSGWGLASALATSLVWISLSYSGFNAAVYVADEVRDARRVVPRALLAGTLAVTVLYVLLNAAFVFSAPPEQLAGMADVAAIAARAVGGPSFEAFVRGTIALCLLTSVFSMLMAAPRVYAKMAGDGLLPACLRFDGAAPRAATLVQAALAMGLVWASTLQGLLSYLGLTLSLSAAGSACCLFLPSVRTKPLCHPVHLAPAFYVTATLAAAAIMTCFDPRQLVGTGLTFAAGAAAYAARRRVVPRDQRLRSLLSPGAVAGPGTSASDAAKSE